MKNFKFSHNSKELWQETLIEISKRVTKYSYDKWVMELTGELTNDNTLVIGAKDEATKEWINDNLNQIIVEVLKELTGRDFNVEITTSVDRSTFKGKLIGEKQALGYMLIACKEVGLSKDLVNQIHSYMVAHLKGSTPEEVEGRGKEWFQSLENKQNFKASRIPENNNSSLSEISKRSLNLVLAKTGESNRLKKLREENLKIIRQLQKRERGPFGLFELFRRCK
ncbi:DnaA N-terminal domain-containing protein [Metabacillus niabensis]|uniref:DnaA N-terminal domain-containing protein n=1 Tax=Metabacillus niabensis TaxID=324854 RepID=UPI0039A14B15